MCPYDFSILQSTVYGFGRIDFFLRQILWWYVMCWHLGEIRKYVVKNDVINNLFCS